MTSITESELTAAWAAVDAAKEEVLGVAKPPRGAFSTRDYMARYGIKQRTAFDQLARLIAAGKLKKIKVASSKAGGGWFVAVKSSQEPSSHERPVQPVVGRSGRRTKR